MAAGEEEQNKEERKGFAGLSSLVSDVDTSLPSPSKQEAATADAASNAERRAASESQQPEPPPKQQPYQAPSQPSSGSSTGKWVLGIAAVIGVLWLIGEADKSPSSPAPSYSPPARSTTPSYSAAPAQPQVPTRPDETKPPVGQDLVFSTAQLRYCLAEDIRMDAAKAVLNNYIDSDVHRFNAMVADYNSRCGRFRYRRGSLEIARRDIESYRNRLYSDGRQRFTHIIPQPGTSELGSAHEGHNNNPSEQLNSSAQSKTTRSDRERLRTHADLSTPDKPRCVYKAVMSNDDYLACGLKPPR